MSQDDEVLAIGTRVSVRDSCHGVVTTRFGNVVETTATRSRVAWDSRECNGRFKELRVKRTWVTTSRLTVLS